VWDCVGCHCLLPTCIAKDSFSSTRPRKNGHLANKNGHLTDALVLGCFYNC
jgi:hypothetical protein